MSSIDFIVREFAPVIAPDGEQPIAGGEIRRKNSNTLVRTLRQEYGPEFAQGYRSDAQLGTVLEREGLDSLHQMLKQTPKT